MSTLLYLSARAQTLFKALAITTAFAAFTLSPLAAHNASAEPASEQPQSDQININTASAAELTQLKGIGAKRAEKIVQDREKNGRFASVDDLTRVKGIGPKTVENNRARMTAGQPVAPVKPAQNP